MALPPTFSPEAVDLITRRVERLSFENSLLFNNDSTPVEGGPAPQTSTPCIPAPVMATTNTSFYKPLSLPPQLLKDEIQEDESQDDLLMHEAEETVSLGRKLFKMSCKTSLSLMSTLTQAGEFPSYDEVSVVEQSWQDLKEYSEDKDRELEEEMRKEVSIEPHGEQYM